MSTDFPVTADSIAKAKAQQQHERAECFRQTGLLIREDGTVAYQPYPKVTCLDCGWIGRDYELLAQACPVCDGRVADV